MNFFSARTASAARALLRPALLQIDSGVCVCRGMAQRLRLRCWAVAGNSLQLARLSRRAGQDLR